MLDKIDHYIASDNQFSDFCNKLNPKLWEYCDHNLIRFLDLLKQRSDNHSRNDIENYYFQLSDELNIDNAKSLLQLQGQNIIAYFSPEIGIAQYLQSYAGGLGVLAGDHIKSASDLKLPLVAVSIFYRKGFFKQKLSKSGTQNSVQIEIDPNDVGINPIINSKGEHEFVEINLPEKILRVYLFQMKIGNVFVILLDSFNEINEDLKLITQTLYDGSREIRLLQEIILGIGGIRALYKLNLIPEIIHINEGHAAFALLEEMRKSNRKLLNDKINYIRTKSLFTTHTPVIHGNEEFDLELISKYFTNSELSQTININKLLNIGKTNPKDSKFSMTVLALNLSNHVNAVSKLHSNTSNNMWRSVIKKNNIKIKGITNGIHFRTWLSTEFKELYDKYLGSDYINNSTINDFTKYLNNISRQDLFSAKRKVKTKLIAFINNYFRLNPPEYIKRDRFEHLSDILHPDCLLIGFARRFAPYKKADLIFTDIERLTGLFCRKNQPVRLIISGKAHPSDIDGKKIIKNIIQIINNNNLDSKIIFIENYDLRIAKHLVQSCDLWLNTPIRTLEASGTSGMKAALNGGVNLSILDGWWDEAYNGSNGWAIGEHDVNNLSDKELSNIVYDKLETEIIPLYFAREIFVGKSWYDYMINSISTVLSHYSSHRMLNDYITMYYEKIKNGVK